MTKPKRLSTQKPSHEFPLTNKNRIQGIKISPVPNIGKTSIIATIIEMVNACFTFNSKSPMKIVTQDILTKMICAVIYLTSVTFNCW